MKKINCVLASIILIFGVLSGSTGCGAQDEGKEPIIRPEGVTELDAYVSDVYNDAESIVTIISDDGFISTADNLNELFGERGIKCTVAGAIRIVEPDLDSWKKILKNGNIDIVSHSYNHIRMEDGTEIAQDIDALRHEIVDADKWYEDTFGGEQIVFVCPENQMCEEGYKILYKNDFWAVRRGHRGYNSLSPEEGIEYGNWFNLMVQGICDEGVNTYVRNGWIDKTISDKAWLIEMWHNVMPEDDGGYQTIMISDAEKHLDYVASKSSTNEIWVATFDEAVKYIREKQNSEVVTYIVEDGLHVYINLTNSNMNYNTFNQPLTVHITIPEQISIEQSDDVKIINGECVINVVPGEEQVVKVLGE